MHYSTAPVSGLSGRIPGQILENYPDWYIRARNATRDHMRNTNMDAITAVRFSVAAFKAAWNRLGRRGEDIADLTGWVRYTVSPGRRLDPSQSVNEAVDNLIRYAVRQI